MTDDSIESAPDNRKLDREILALAVPAFATLVAEPLLLLADSAIIGHLATPALAGLGVAANVVSVTIGLCIFLAYGTTGSVARRLGAGDRRGALADGLDGITLGVVIGVGLAVAIFFLAPTLVGLYGADGEVFEYALRYLQLVALGFPAVLSMLAATGVLRGLQNTRIPMYVAVAMNLANIAANFYFVYGLHLGIAGAAVGTLISQYAAAIALVSRVISGARNEQIRYRPNPRGILEQAKTGGWLVLRTLGLQAALVLTTMVASRMGAKSMAAHQILNSIWALLTYAMDAVAIAAQAIIARYLGAGEPAIVRRLMKRMLGYGVGLGLTLGFLVWAGSRLYLGVFTPDAHVRELVAGTLIAFALTTPVSGVVFVLDGVLIGAGDARYLALAHLVNFLTYLPLALAVMHTQAGIFWLWLAYCGFMVSRIITLSLRARGTAWMRLGA
ncbi:MAG: MATE family efflux transporter [Propionibacteriaceae bacterium]|jgi:putative MATE family efflux protein|nr:MATE family efflux transporter [Propionibacteriaceae bacterium]